MFSEVPFQRGKTKLNKKRLIFFSEQQKMTIDNSVIIAYNNVGS